MLKKTYHIGVYVQGGSAENSGKTVNFSAFHRKAVRAFSRGAFINYGGRQRHFRGQIAC